MQTNIEIEINILVDSKTASCLNPKICRSFQKNVRMLERLVNASVHVYDTTLKLGSFKNSCRACLTFKNLWFIFWILSGRQGQSYHEQIGKALQCGHLPHRTFFRHKSTLLNRRGLHSCKKQKM